MRLSTSSNSSNRRIRSTYKHKHSNILHAAMLLLPLLIILHCCHAVLALVPPSEYLFRKKQQQQQQQDYESSSTTNHLKVHENGRTRELQVSTAAMEGSCTGNTLQSGQQRAQGSYLCYPASNPTYKFGIDSSNQLAFYVNDELTWVAKPPSPETSSCIVFGTGCTTPLHYFRLQSSGSLAGYNEDRSKVWDSHLNEGSYASTPNNSPNKVTEKQSGSTLELKEDGRVVVYDQGDVATWQIDAPVATPTKLPTTSPTIKAMTKSPTNKPTLSPTRTKSPTKPPTNTPSEKPTGEVTLGSIQGFLWDDTPTLDGLYNSGDLPLDSVSVSLTTCDGNDPLDMLFADSPRENEEHVFVKQTATTLQDGTFSFPDLKEGRYIVSVSPPTNRDVSKEWEFVSKNANNADGSSSVLLSYAAEDSNLNDDGTSDCIIISSSGSENTVLEHLVYGGLMRVSNEQKEVSTGDNSIPTDSSVNAGDREEITVSGTVFWDANGDGLFDDDISSDSTSAQDMGNLVVDLYSCTTDEEWVVLTRTDSSSNNNGRYQFNILTSSTNSRPGSYGETTTNLSMVLERKDIARFKVVVSLPQQLSDSSGRAYAFSPASPDNDVNSIGESPCWDVNLDGRGNIVWNAGVTIATMSSPTTRPLSPIATPTSGNNNSPSGGFIGGYSFYDANNDGVRDDEDPTLEGLSVRLYSCSPGSNVNSDRSGTTNMSGAAYFMNGIDRNDSSSTSAVTQDELLAITKTDNQGLYSFQNLFSGYYRVAAQPLSGYQVSSVGGDATGESTECVELVGDVTDISYDIAMVLLNASDNYSSGALAESSNSLIIISGMAFEDLNNNGKHDSEESLESSVIENSIPNVQVALFTCTLLSSTTSSISDTRYDFTITDNNGMYGFDSAKPGEYYQVQFSPPDGYAISEIWDTGLIANQAETVDNHADPITESTSCRQYQGGDEMYSLDAGLVPNAIAAGGSTVSPNTTSELPTEASPTTTIKPTLDPKGDGTPCSGPPCDIPGMCRNKSGLCGSGIGFCNHASVWAVNCPPAQSSDSIANAVPATPLKSDDGVAPTIAPLPSPSGAPSVSTFEYVPTGAKDVCNDDGSLGASTATAEAVNSTEVEDQEIKPQLITFEYAIGSTSIESDVDPTMVAAFENELQRQLGCVYFNAPDCLSCGGDSGDGRKVRERRALSPSSSQQSHAREQRLSLSRTTRGIHRATQTEVVGGDNTSSMIGLSSSPQDTPLNSEACSDSTTTPQSCRVMNGQFTAYFSTAMSASQIQAETTKILIVVESEMKEMNNGLLGNTMLVSYDNTPFRPANSVVWAVGAEIDAGGGGSDGGDSDNGGLSIGDITGIVIGVIVLLAIIAMVSIAFIRRKREKDDAEFDALSAQGKSASRAVPFGSIDSQDLAASASINASGGSSDDDDDSHYSTSSSEDSDSMNEDEVGSGSNTSFPSSAISGDAGTNVAQAQMEDIDEDDDEDESSTESFSTNHDDESSTYDFGEVESPEKASDIIQRLNNKNSNGDGDNVMQLLKQSTASDENPAVYEDHKNSGEFHGADEHNLHDNPYNDGNYAEQDDNGRYDVSGQEAYIASDDQQQQRQGYNDHSGDYNGDFDNKNRGYDDTASIISADPPGTSYRDLPQEEGEWEIHHNRMSTMGAAPSQQMTDDGFADDRQYVNDSQVNISSPGYRRGESTGSSSLNSSYGSLAGHGNISGDEEHNGSYESLTGHGTGSNDGSRGNFSTSVNSGSHHSGSHHSLGFDGSNQSHHSEQGSRHSAHSHGSPSQRSSNSHLSSHLQQQQQGDEKNENQLHQDDYGQYDDNNNLINWDNYDMDGNDQNYLEDNQDYAEGNHAYEIEDDNYDDSHNLLPPRFNNNEYVEHDHTDVGNSNMGHDDYTNHHGNHNNMVPDSHHQYDNGMLGEDSQYSIDQYGDQYSPHAQPGNNDYRNTNENNHTSFDEESYHSFNPISTSFKSESHPEELDEEVSVSRSASTASEHQMSNISSVIGNVVAGSSRSSSNNASPSARNTQQHEESYGEEEESITNIFNQLSQIQNRLSKGKPSHPDASVLPESSLMQNDGLRITDRKISDEHAAVNYNQTPPLTSSGNVGWGKEGIVEDASIDGSQVSSFATRAMRNRPPQQGQWMEPVGED